jgi:hypothetical protein
MKSRSETLDRFVKAFLFNAIMEYYKNLDLADIKYLGSFTNEYDAHLAYEKALK